MKHILRRLLLAPLLAPLLHILPAAAGDALDTSFIREEPFKKQKQVVDLSTVRSAADLAIVREAINPIMRLVVALSYARFPESVSREVMTENGRRLVQLPPIRNKNNRYTSAEVGNWRVCSAERLAFTATYIDPLKRQDTWTRSFVFTKTGGVWRFHEHGDAEGKFLCN